MARYDDSTKAQAVARALQLESEGATRTAAIREASSELGMPEGTLRGWIRAGVQPAAGSTPTTLTEEVDKAVSAMPWIVDSDKAAVALARSYAQRIDEAVANGEGQEVTKALYLGPHLLNTLRALGGAPAERKTLTQGEGGTGGKLATLRSIEGGRSKRSS